MDVEHAERTFKTGPLDVQSRSMQCAEIKAREKGSSILNDDGVKQAYAAV